MRGLKILVTIMTLLLIGGTGFLGYSIVTKAGKLAATPDMAPLQLPVNSDIKEMAGYEDGVALYVSSPEGEFIYLYNLASGKMQGRIKVQKGL